MISYKKTLKEIKRRLKGGQGQDAKAWQSYLKEQAEAESKKEETQSEKKLLPKDDLQVFLPKRKHGKKKRRPMSARQRQRILRLCLLAFAALLLLCAFFFGGRFVIGKIKGRTEKAKTQEMTDFRLYESEEGSGDGNE